MNLVTLTKKDFTTSSKEVVVKNANTPGMLLVFGNHCSFCHRFLPTYQQLAAKMDPARFKITIVETADVSPQMNALLRIQGVPSMFFFNQQGKIIAEYDGPDRNLSTIEDHICNVYHYCASKKR